MNSFLQSEINILIIGNQSSRASAHFSCTCSCIVVSAYLSIDSNLCNAPFAPISATSLSTYSLSPLYFISYSKFMREK
nr:MAG TPA: hypothetical protein [Caudoviricetes sp.]